MDRGYFSAALLQILTNAGIKVIFRMSMVPNCVKKFAKSNKNDIITTVTCEDGSFIKFRLIKYYIGKKVYFLGTTIMNKTVAYFKDIYWKRWSVEINFRESKYLTSLDNVMVGAPSKTPTDEVDALKAADYYAVHSAPVKGELSARGSAWGYIPGPTEKTTYVNAIAHLAEIRAALAP